jgi:murein DD-endopeptidase MepM/ murein hydrolase activator NlpD
LGYRSRIRRLRQNWGRLIDSGRRRGSFLVKQALPYLDVKYWWIYLLASALGFYLAGPCRGWQKLSQANFVRRIAAPTPQSMTTLQREMRRLKRELRELQVKQKSMARFAPEQFRPPAPEARIIQGYQWTLNRHIWRLHPGVDFEAPPGSAVLAAAAGRVVDCERTASGFRIKLSHGNDWESVYADLAAARVRVGQMVQTGQTVGISGLVQCVRPGQAGFHFGLYHQKKPVDPSKILKSN